MLSIPSKNACLITAAKYAYQACGHTSQRFSDIPPIIVGCYGIATPVSSIAVCFLVNYVQRKAVCLISQNMSHATKLKPTAVFAAKCCC